MHTPKKFRRPTPRPAAKPNAPAPNPPPQSLSPQALSPPNLPFRGDPAQPKNEAKQGRKVRPDTQGRKVTSEPTGRAISARNATTHGLFARDVVLPTLGEDPAAYEALLTQLCEQLPPRNMLERHYLEQIAAASWRLRRLHRWQAQVYEDPALTEDERLDRLDKTLRHETTLTRQIDRAVRTLNRDLKWLFEGRARDEALYKRDLTPNEIRAEPALEIEVQRDIWRRLRPAPAPDLGDARLDNTPTDTRDNTITAQKCENEPPADAPPPTSPPPTSPPPTSPNPPTVGGPQRSREGGSGEAGSRHETLTPPELGAGGPPGIREKCENEPTVSSETPTPPPHPGEPRSPIDTGFPPLQGRDRALAPEGEADTKCENEPGAGIAQQKRIHELCRKFDPTTPEIDWEDQEIRQAYGTSGRQTGPKLNRAKHR